MADQVCQMKALRLTGGWDAIGTSNVVPNELRFDFHAFKKLSKLVLQNVRCSPEHITSLGMVRRTLKHLQARTAYRSVQSFTNRWALGCEKFMPGRAWLLISKTGPPFRASLYVPTSVNSLSPLARTKSVFFRSTTAS